MKVERDMSHEAKEGNVDILLVFALFLGDRQGQSFFWSIVDSSKFAIPTSCNVYLGITAGSSTGQFQSHGSHR